MVEYLKRKSKSESFILDQNSQTSLRAFTNISMYDLHFKIYLDNVFQHIVYLCH